MTMADLPSGSNLMRVALGATFNTFGCTNDLVCNHVDKNDLTKTVGDHTCPDKPDGLSGRPVITICTILNSFSGNFIKGDFAGNYFLKYNYAVCSSVDIL